jgi:hypothetical protein
LDVRDCCNINYNSFASKQSTEKVQQVTFGLLPGWVDVDAMSSSYQSAAAMGRPFLNLDFVNFKFNLLTMFCGWADGSQKPARQQAVDVRAQ